MPSINPRKTRLSLSGQSRYWSASRRRFLQLSTAALSGTLLANCARNITDSGASPEASPAAATGSPTGDNTLHVYSWSSYIDDALLKDFESKTGITVVADIYDSNETMLAKMQAGGGSAYSIIYPSDYMVEQMIELDLLTELDKSRLPSTDTLIEQWQSPPYDPENRFSYPFAWGTTGLVYNSEVLDPAPEDWEYLWEEQEQLSRKMTMLNDVREVFGAVLKSLGYSNSTTDEAEIQEAYERLAELKPAINAFTTDAWRDQLVVGDLVMAHAYSVDAIDAMSANDKLRYVVPASGATVWGDTVVIPKSAPNVDAAYEWMNYILSPENSTQVVERLKFATPNKQTFDALPSALKEDPSLFPPDATLAKCEPLSNVGDSIELYDRLWTQLTSA
ncbi:spermidine/putrescine ABC transporter substrate-binding protein [Oscillatoria sp. FACHB-1407]|uniref:polyamine ABC transporter substrate-binding protein n=1 Tax=Oscillatoria sp. FACHB-1407 TaxID=2692847 RepID=UPI0016821674|nr:spermidine/putrescine ABC transporter substrate-binding protein [Oscillatoria sp. FACHB-1407]MBD2459533.1 spermidine/putrescine ABC transporter substrate-binding protein [Oscillatoria sp. FACHB-1407]